MGRISELASCVCCLNLCHGDTPAAKNTKPSANASILRNTTPGEQDLSTDLGAAPNKPPGEPNVHFRGWDKAYDELKQKEPDLVEKYEELIDLRPTATSEAGSTMEQAFSNRRVQMKTIAEAAMSRTEKELRTKSKLDEGMKVVELARDVGTSVMQNFPQAALPWAGVCAALQLFRNPLTESQAQRDGMVRVIIRMNWYCELDSQLSEKSSSGLLTALEQKMITLFEALLAFLMRSVCSCFKNRIGQTLRDALRLNQWEQALEDIKELEEEFRHDAEYEGLAAIRSDLGKLLEFAKEKEFQVLKEMNFSLEKLVSERIIERESQCMQALRLGDSKQQKLIIENSKGRQNKDLGSWIVDTDQFDAWRKANESSVLWIHGDAGKGKTMLLCEIIDSLQRSISNPDTLSYFFCEAIDPKSNTFAAILRGIIYDLAKKHPDLIQHVENVYRHAGTNAFSEEGSWVTLMEILFKMTDSLAPGTTYFVIDALDECQKDRNLLLRFIVDKALAQPNIKWILSSRNWDDIQQALGESSHILSLSLEDNAENVSRAVHTFVEDKVKDLAEKKHYDGEFAEAVKHRLLQDAQGTFLWVALVCERLYAADSGSVWAQVELEDSPPGLKGLYDNMMEKIINHKERELCLHIIACVALVYQPVTLQELVTCLHLPNKLTKHARTHEQLVEALTPVVTCCSFLTQRGGFIHFVHQSAADYLIESRKMELFPSGQSQVHHSIFRQSLQSLTDCNVLDRDIYKMEARMSIGAFGTPVGAVEKPDPDPLSPIAYCCIYWIDHLVCSITDGKSLAPDLRDGGSVHNFLQTKFLYWLEALSLLGSIPEGFISVTKLLVAVQNAQTVEGLKISRLLDFIKDARQFFSFHRDVIEQFPLQAYTSTLVFSPMRSLVRQKFAEDMPPWIYIHSGVGEQWHDCSLRIKAVEGQLFQKMALSQDGKWIATLDDGKMIRLWDRASGRCTRCSMVDMGLVTSYVMTFSNNSQQIAVTSSSGETRLLEVATLDCILKFATEYYFLPQRVRFSRDDKQIIIASWYELCSWDVTTKSWRKMPISEDEIMDLSLTGELCLSMARYFNRDLTIRDITTGNVVSARCEWPENDSDEESLAPERKVFFSPDGRLVARCTSFISIWDTTTEAIILTIHGYAKTLCFSYDNKFIACSPYFSHKIKVVEVATGELVREMTFFEGESVDCLMFFQDGRHIVSLQEESIRIWDTWDFSEQQHTVMRNPSSAFVLVSPDEDLVFWMIHEVAKMLNLKSNEESDLVADAGGEMTDIQFTPDWQIMSLRNAAEIVRVFEVKSSRCIRTIPQPAEYHCLSHDGQLVSTTHLGPDSVYVVTVWSISSGVKLHTFTTLNKEIYDWRKTSSFSLNGTYLAFVGKTHFHAWDIAAGDPTCAFELSDTSEIWDFDLFNHRDDVIISSELSAPTIRSLNGNQHERLVRLPLEGQGEFPEATRISKDDKLLVMYFHDSSQIWIWDVASNTCRQKIDGRGCWLPYPTFHESNVGLTTSAGDVVIDPNTNGGISVEDIQLSGVSLLGQGPWIAWQGQNILMKPAEYEIMYSSGASCKGRTVAFGSDSGELVVLRIDL